MDTCVHYFFVVHNTICRQTHCAVYRFIVLNVPPIAGTPLFMPPFTPADMSAAAQVSLQLSMTQ